MNQYLVCPSCDKSKPPKSFEGVEGKRTRYCHVCRTARDFKVDLGRTWDWAAALHKSTAIAVKKAYPYDGNWSDMSPQLIRTMDILQEGKCAITGIPFLKPGPNELPRGQSFADWIMRQRLTERGAVPALVRATGKPNWEPGNVMLIIAALEPLYRHCGSAAATMNQFRTGGRRDLLVPVAEVVRETMDFTSNKLYEEWKRLRKQESSETTAE